MNLGGSWMNFCCPTFFKLDPPFWMVHSLILRATKKHVFSCFFSMTTAPESWGLAACFWGISTWPQQWLVAAGCDSISLRHIESNHLILSFHQQADVNSHEFLVNFRSESPSGLVLWLPGKQPLLLILPSSLKPRKTSQKQLPKQKWYFPYGFPGAN